MHQFFFKIHIADSFHSSFGQAWLNQQPFPEIMVIWYFRVLWACQACLTTTNKNFMIKLQFPWISYYMQKENFLPQLSFEILKFKKLCNLIGWEHFQLQLRKLSHAVQEIFQSHVVFIDSQRWCIIQNQKITLMDQIIFQNLYCRFFSEHSEYAWLNWNKITWSNCNIHENITTLKKELYISKSFCDIKF